MDHWLLKLFFNFQVILPTANIRKSVKMLMNTKLQDPNLDWNLSDILIRCIATGNYCFYFNRLIKRNSNLQSSCRFHRNLWAVELQNNPTPSIVCIINVVWGLLYPQVEEQSVSMSVHQSQPVTLLKITLGSVKKFNKTVGNIWANIHRLAPWTFSSPWEIIPSKSHCLQVMWTTEGNCNSSMNNKYCCALCFSILKESLAGNLLLVYIRKNYKIFMIWNIAGTNYFSNHHLLPLSSSHSIIYFILPREGKTK